MKKRDLPKLVALFRFQYHANMLDVVNVANQLHLLSDEQAEMKNKKHAMIIVYDLLPRISGKSLEEIFKKD